jgi:phosphate transport system substrate-binding protein
LNKSGICDSKETGALKLPTREKILGVAVFLVVSLLLNFCVAPVACAEEVIRIGGVGGALGTMRILASAFQKSHPEIKVVVLASIGTRGALKAVPDGVIDIGLLGMSSKDEGLISGETVTKYARTPFIFVTGRPIEKKGLTLEEVARIYRGDTRRWPGGERIRTILRRPDESDNLILEALSPGIKMALERSFSRPGLLFAITDQDNLDIIEKTPGALGYTTLAQVIAEKRRVKVFSLNGVMPSAGTLVNGSYPVSKTFAMMTRQEPSGKVLKFINFVKSEEGSKILKENGNMVIGNE